MKDKILMIVFVLVLGSILTTALVTVNFFTTPVIEKNEQIATKSSILKALNIIFDADSVEEIFAENVEQRQEEGTIYYVTADSNIAFSYSGSGLWGPIEGIIAVQPDFETLKGITIIRQEETPGLGSRITEADYLAQFEGKRFAEGLKLVQPGRGSADNEIDSITGATMTSDAFISILNENLQVTMPAIRQGENQ
ncbi:MAG: FMN-binding protein [Spirochaetaceae bacterium]|nr:MAG: FMN-binding protein [Spirochaetaceae bacterium]